MSQNRFVTTILPSIAALAVLCLALSSCQSSRYKEFDSIHGGMTKGEVLASMGNPARTQRWHGRDRWEYTLYGHPDGDIKREVHFEDGKSTYVGPAIKPPVSADEQDRINDIANHEANLRDSEMMKSQETGVHIQRFEPVGDSGESGALKIENKPGISQ